MKGKSNRPVDFPVPGAGSTNSFYGELANVVAPDAFMGRASSVYGMVSVADLAATLQAHSLNYAHANSRSRLSIVTLVWEGAPCRMRRMWRVWQPGIKG